MSTEITINQDIVEINVTEEVVTIEAPSGAYPLPNLVSSVFGRVGAVVATEGDYTLTQLGGVTITSPTNNQVLKYNGTQWVNSSDTDTGLTSVGLSMPSAFSVANSPLTANGTLSVTGAGTTAQYVRGDGSLATLPSLTGFVPYTGATANVDLGTFNLTADVITGATGSFASNGGSNTFAINHSSGSGIALNITKGGNGEGLYINKTSGSGNAATIIGTLNATTLVKSGGTSSQYLMADGSVSTLTNPVTGTGTTNTLPKFTGASTIGNSNVSDSGTLITLGSNSSINGQLVIGGSIEAGFNLIVNKTITGGVNAIGVYQKGIVQSDVTGVGFGFNNQLGTQATTFTISQYRHYSTNQQTLGAGSSIGTQIGFQADNTLTGATNNYGFRGLIPSGTNRWNLYMDGTAANYLAGDTAIGTTTLGTATQLTIGGTETAVSAISRGQLINTTLVASSNSDNLIALDIAPTFTYGVFGNAVGYGIRNAQKTTLNDVLSITGGGSTPSGLGNGIHINFTSNIGTIQSVQTGVAGRQLNIMGNPLFFGNSNTGTLLGSFTTSGNFILQNGGTFTDAGFRLDVNGTTRFIGTASSDTAPLGAELAAVTGTGTNWTLAGTNLNVGGYTHTTGSVDPLTTALAAVNGTYYQIAYTITGRTTGSITINYGGAAVGGLTATGTTGPLASSTAVLTITPTTDFNGTVVLSIKTIGTSSASSTFSNSASTSNIEVRASSLTSNTFIGLNSGRRTTTATENTFFGFNTGANNTTGIANTFIGQRAGLTNITGGFNTFIGTNAGLFNTIGGSNTYIGTSAGQSNTTGSLNSFLGTNAGINNTTGSSNTFIGLGSGTNNTTGGNNTFVGRSAGQANTTGGNNDAFGIFALSVNTTGFQNTAFGNFSLASNTTGFYNSASGQGALQANTTGSYNTALGYVALNNNTTGTSNTAIGTEAGRFITGGVTANTNGNNSIFIGTNTKAAADGQANQIVIGNGTTGLGSNTTIIGTTATTLTALYGDLLLGTTTPSTATILTVSGTETASSAVARGGLINTTLVASANGDALVGLDIAPTFTNGAFTGVTNYALRVANSLFINGSPAILTMGTNNLSNSSIVANGPIDISAQGVSVFNATTLGTRVFSRGTATANGVSLGLASTDYLRVVPTTGNVLIQAGGTFTDAGFRLDVQGTARVQGNSATGILNVTNQNTSIGISMANLLASGATGDTYFSIGRALSLNNCALVGHSTVGGGNYAFITVYGRPASDFAVTSTGSIGIGTSLTNTSARLQIDSTTQGFLPPRMTTVQKLAIGTPAAGLMVYDTTLNQMSYFNGTIWINF
jgi:hypothetical protein